MNILPTSTICTEKQKYHKVSKTNIKKMIQKGLLYHNFILKEDKSDVYQTKRGKHISRDIIIKKSVKKRSGVTKDLFIHRKLPLFFCKILKKIGQAIKSFKNKYYHQFPAFIAQYQSFAVFTSVFAYDFVFFV